MAKINEVYKESQVNKVKDSEIYSMPLNDFIKEHKKLIGILREGSREELLAEAKEQESELEECLEEHGIKDKGDD